MRFRRIALGLILPLCFCFAQSTGEQAKKALLADLRYQFSQAELDVAQEDYADAFRLYKLAADQGDRSRDPGCTVDLRDDAVDWPNTAARIRRPRDRLLCRNAGEHLQSIPRLGGLHHRYFRAKAA